MAEGAKIDASKVVARLQALARKMPNEIARALYEEALIEQKESMRRTPVLTGALRASHQVLSPVINRGDVSVSIVVGGPAAPYAWEVHENIDAEHKNGQSKFLESTIMESRPFIPERIARRIELYRLV